MPGSKLTYRRAVEHAMPAPVEVQYHSNLIIEGNTAWLERWVFGVDDWKGFLDRIGPEVLDQVRIRQPMLSEPLDYGA